MNTQQLRQKILDLAIRGQLVPQDENDEPAQVLLERIRAEKQKNLPQKGKKKTSHLSPYQNEEDFPFQIPENWAWCRLGEVCLIKGGKRLPKNVSFSDEKTKYVYIRVADMKNNTILINDLKYINEDVRILIKNYTISKDDLYLTIAGTIGKVGIVPYELDNMNLTENAAKLSEINIDKLFLMYFLSSRFVQEQFQSNFHQVAQPKLSLETAGKTIICIPPLSEQTRIVSKIEEIFALIDTIEQNQSDLKTTIEKTKAKVLDMAIRGELLNDENRSLENSDNKHYTDEEFPFPIPKHWQWKKLGEVCDMYQPKTITTAEITSEGLYKVFGANGVIGFYDKYNHEESEVAVTCRGATCGNVNLTTPKSWITGNAMVIKPWNNDIDKIYLFYYMKATDMSFIITGSAQPQITKINMNKLYISIPPLEEQKRIVQKIEEIFSELDKIETFIN